MRRLRVLLLTLDELAPTTSARTLHPYDRFISRTERHVLEGLRTLGHDVRTLGLDGSLEPLNRVIDQWPPHVVFNLLLPDEDPGVDELRIAEYLESLGIPCTGCRAQALALARDKAATKTILERHGVRTPAFHLVRRGSTFRSAVSDTQIVKPNDGSGSYGIALAAVASTTTAIRNRIAHVHRKLKSDALVERFIAGRELTIGVLGNVRPTALPIREIKLPGQRTGTPRVQTERMKWTPPDGSNSSRLSHTPARGIPMGVQAEVASLARGAYRALGLRGFARTDIRLDEDLTPYVIDVNPNCDLDKLEPFARSARQAGIAYPNLLQRIITLASATG